MDFVFFCCCLVMLCFVLCCCCLLFSVMHPRVTIVTSRTFLCVILCCCCLQNNGVTFNTEPPPGTQTGRASPCLEFFSVSNISVKGRIQSQQLRVDQVEVVLILR